MPGSGVDLAPSDIIGFWFGEPMCRHWFRATDDLDRKIRERFEGLWRQAADRGLAEWQQTAEGCLALAIVLDQFPLNMYRGEPRSYATEAQSIEIALQAVDRGFDCQLPVEQRAFLYMPLMHSEKLQHQDLAVQLFDGAELEANARFARHHRDLIKRFGRFPHRNAILGRSSDRGERAYLASKEAFTG